SRRRFMHAVRNMLMCCVTTSRVSCVCVCVQLSTLERRGVLIVKAANGERGTPLPDVDLSHSRGGDDEDADSEEQQSTGSGTHRPLIRRTSSVAVDARSLLPPAPSMVAGDSDIVTVNEEIGAEDVANGTMTYLFLCSLLWSFVDTYFVAALTLLT